MRSPGRSLGGVPFSGLLRSGMSWLRSTASFFTLLNRLQPASGAHASGALLARVFCLSRLPENLGHPLVAFARAAAHEPRPSQSGGEMNTNERLLATFQCFGLFGLASAAPSDHRINRRERRRAGDVDSPVEAATRTRLPRESLWCAGSTPTRTGWARRTEIERWPLKARRARWCRCLYTARSHCRG